MKVYSLHPFTHDVKSLLSYLRVEDIGGLEWNSNNPDILFASEHIYLSKGYSDKFKQVYNNAKIKVIIEGEAVKPDWNLFDYAIGFDNAFQDPDRFIRWLSPLDRFSKFISNRKNDITSENLARVELSKKKGFCNFLYSNSNAHPMRDKLFYEISKYKKVDSLGKYLNNIGKLGTGYFGHAHECVAIKNPYKFSIASENASYNGYTSEKIFTSLAAHTIPIYFGNPDIYEDVNPDAFINANDFSSLDSLIDYIKEIDNDDNLWCKYISAPWFTKEQVKNHIDRTKDYKTKIHNLFKTSQMGGGRLSLGTHSDLYRENFIRNYNFKDSFLQQVIEKIKKHTV